MHSSTEAPIRRAYSQNQLNLEIAHFGIDYNCLIFTVSQKLNGRDRVIYRKVTSQTSPFANVRLSLYRMYLWTAEQYQVQCYNEEKLIFQTSGIIKDLCDRAFENTVYLNLSDLYVSFRAQNGFKVLER